MYGDLDVMRRHSGRLREQGDDLRAAADRLVARSEAAPWSGRAADAMRERVRERASHLREVAGAHDVAADSLDRHALEVDRLREAIAATERRVTGLVEEARGRARAGVPPHDGDEALLALDLPPTGHADWLHLELPGL